MTAIRIPANLAAGRSPRPPLACAGITRIGGRDAATRRSPPRAGDPRGPERGPGGASRRPPPSASMARSAAASSAARSPRFQATRIPPGASSGKASSTSSASPATARAVTAGHRPRWRGVGGQRLGPDGGRLGASPGRRPPRSPCVEEAGLLADRLGQQDARRREARSPGAGPGSRRPTRRRRTGRSARSRSSGSGAQAVDDVSRAATAPGSRIAVRLIASCPGQQEAGVPVDRRARASVVRWTPEDVEATWRGRPRRPAADRESRRRASGAAYAVSPRHASSGSRAVQPRGAAPGVGIVSHHRRGLVFPGPFGSRSGLPEPLADRVTRASTPVRMPDGRRPPGVRQRGFPPTRPRPPELVDNRPAISSLVHRCGPAGRASAGRRRSPRRRTGPRCHARRRSGRSPRRDPRGR